MLSAQLGAIVAFLRRELDGKRTIADIRQLTRWSRTPGSSGYRAAAAFVADALREACVDDASVHSYPMDGQATYRGWTTEPAWDVDRAEIRVISPYDLPLADHATSPIAIHQGSWATPAAGLETPLVDVGSGIDAEDYDGTVVEGAVVLADGPTQQVYDRAVRERGAAGVLSHHMPWTAPEVGRTPEQLPDLVSQGKLRVRLDDDARGFAFSISHRRAAELKSHLAEGVVTVRARIDGGPVAGHLEVVTGTIPGGVSPEHEVVLVAHLCHPSPGANDNASGVALAVEIARCLAAAREKLDPLRFSIRFLFVPEIIGPLAFLASGLVDREQLIGGINLDMVGAAQSITRSPILFENTPWSLPTVLFDLGARLLELGHPSSRDRLWSYRPVPFEGGSDNIVFNDATIGAPMVGFGYRADPCYHSNLDVWTNMDPTILENVGLAAGGLAWTAAAMDAELADEVLNVVANARDRRGGERPRSVERTTIESVRRRVPKSPEVDAVVKRHLARLSKDTGVNRGCSNHACTALERAGLAPNDRPRRIVSSLVWPPINGTSRFLANLPVDHELKRRMDGYEYIRAMRCIYELLNQSDGTRQWRDVIQLVADQFDGATQDEVVELAVALCDSAALDVGTASR